jgi:hypothetical protein
LRGAAFVEALMASVALAGLVAAGLLLFRRWEHAAAHLDERATTFAVALAGCGRRRDLASEVAFAWRSFEPRAFARVEPPARTFVTPNREMDAGLRRESFACNERAGLFANEVTQLRRDIERRILERSK